MLETPSELITGFLHVFISPLHALGLVTAGLCLGATSTKDRLVALTLLAAGVYAGGLALALGGPFLWATAATQAITILAALLVLIAAPPGLALLTALAMLGAAHGATNLIDIPPALDMTGFLVGVLAAFTAGAFVLSTALNRLPDTPRLITRRIAASWVVAITVLIAAADSFSG